MMSTANLSVNGQPVSTSALDDEQIPEPMLSYGRELCKELAAMVNPASKGKYDTMMVAKCYARTEWNQLTEKQRKKVVQVWKDLPQETKDALMKKICSAGPPAINISQNTNKNDRARLLHLFCDPSHTARWTAAIQVKDRLTLDDKENPNDHYGHLADCFNNYEAYPYRNVTANFDENSHAGDGPMPTLETAYEMCKDINPSAGLVTRPLRSSDWIVSQLRDFKAEWAKAYANYKLSGNHDAENPVEEFAKFCMGNEILMYAFVLFQGQDGANLNDMLGKTLSDFAVGDTGILSSPTVAGTVLSFSSPPVAKSSRAATQGSRSGSTSSTGPPAPRTIVLDITLDMASKKCPTVALTDRMPSQYIVSLRLNDS